MSSPEQIGCFDVLLLSGGRSPKDAGRWSFTNRFNGIPHVTYGTRAEIEEQARLQTEAWERKKHGVKKLGSAWRDQKQKKWT